MSLIELRLQLNQYADMKKSETYRLFFKSSRNDIFLGVTAILMRRVAKNFWQISLTDVLSLMKSQVHDERAVAHAILRLKFDKGNEKEKNRIFTFYIKNRHCIRDWGGVDDSAPYIVGAHLLDGDKKILYELAYSKNIWDRRIAIVATWWFIRKNQMHDTLGLAKILLHDKEDLIHKAVGWMLREVGKRDLASLKAFLREHHKAMPRTMLRYAIEKFSQSERSRYLN